MATRTRLAIDPTTRQLTWQSASQSAPLPPLRIIHDVVGTTVKRAREYNVRGLLAYLSLVPRDMDTQRRWKVPGFHRDWHEAAFVNQNVNIIGPIEHGKSETFTLGRLSWEIGHHPGRHYAILSQAHDGAKRRVGAIGELIKLSPEYRAVFPNVRPADGNWAKESFTVERPNIGDQNPTLYAWSVHGQGPGSRLHGLVCDDAVDEKSTRTAELRLSDSKWIRGTAFTRLLRKGFIWNLQNAWHAADFGSELEAEGWPTVRAAARTRDGRMLWYDRFDEAWYAATCKKVGFHMAPGLLDGKPRSDTSGLFREEWARRALTAGLGQKLRRSARLANDDSLITIGADPAHKRTAGRGDLMSVATIVGDPDGAWGLLWIEHDSREARWGAHGLMAHLVDHRHRYPDARMFCEDNGGQDIFVQLAQGDAEREVKGKIPTLEPVNTGSDKNDPSIGIQGLFADMATGACAIPCDRVSGEGEVFSFDADPVVHRLISQCFDFEPGKHTGDVLMSAWLARKGLRLGSGKVEVIGDWRR